MGYSYKRPLSPTLSRKGRGSVPRVVVPAAVGWVEPKAKPITQINAKATLRLSSNPSGSNSRPLSPTPLVKLLANRLSPQAGKSLVIPQGERERSGGFRLQSFKFQLPSPLTGEGWGRGWWGTAASSPSDETTSQSTKPASRQVAGYPQPSPQGERGIPRIRAALFIPQTACIRVSRPRTLSRFFRVVSLSTVVDSNKQSLNPQER